VIGGMVEFLRARLNEDEQLAREQDLLRAGEPYSDGSGTADRDGFPSYPWGAEQQELEFMAGPGHPARVLAEVQAKRRIVELHPNEQMSTRDGDGEEWTDATCGRCLEPFPCRTLCLLALPYADHEQFREEWRP
jgi:hypothetical protein